MITATIAPTFASFRERARSLLAEDVAPEEVFWDDGSSQRALFAGASGSPAATSERAGPGPALPRAALEAFVEKGELASLHRDPDRWALLYRIVYRMAHGERELLEVTTDPDTARLAQMVIGVRRDEHRMHAFLRFRRVPTEGAEAESFVAWYEPDHDILELAAPHFARRYPNMRWVILTPHETAVWSGTELRFERTKTRADAAPRTDELEDLFRVYYASVFNPARTNLAMFERHVPSRFQAAMPELRANGALVASASARTDAMRNKKASPSLAFVPPDADHRELARAAKGCEACHLYKNATQTVFGEGPTDARIVFVGEQPGDQEDRQGHPFVGPAGKVFDAALELAAIPRDQVYVTNAVKHFKWEPRGKRRIHAKPNAMEVHACNGWLEAEIALVEPDVIVCLGATAAQAFMGRTFRITKSRGELLDGAPWAKTMLATYHPSALLRMEGDEAEEAKAHFEADLAKVASLVGFDARSASRRAKGRSRSAAP